MSGARQHCQSAVGELERLGNWEAPHEAGQGLDTADMMHELAGVARAYTVALYRIAGQVEQGPYTKLVSDLLSSMVQYEAGVALWADDLGPVFEREHERDLERLRSPRPGEQIWNVLGRPRRHGPGAATAGGARWSSPRTVDRGGDADVRRNVP